MCLFIRDCDVVLTFKVMIAWLGGLQQCFPLFVGTTLLEFHSSCGSCVRNVCSVLSQYDHYCILVTQNAHLFLSKCVNRVWLQPRKKALLNMFGSALRSARGNQLSQLT